MVPVDLERGTHFFEKWKALGGKLIFRQMLLWLVTFKHVVLWYLASVTREPQYRQAQSIDCLVGNTIVIARCELIYAFVANTAPEEATLREMNLSAHGVRGQSGLVLGSIRHEVLAVLANPAPIPTPVVVIMST
jgi:hypothetical protein